MQKQLIKVTIKKLKSLPEEVAAEWYLAGKSQANSYGEF